MDVHIYTDGGSRGNPGPAASGAVIKTADGKLVAEVMKYLGKTTNNQAEYTAIVIGLERAMELGAKTVSLFLDSELATKQLKGEYKVKNPEIAKRFLEVKNLVQQFDRVTFTHVRREYNKEADALVNKCLDNQAC
ncbi:ribonuclease H [Candidatus Uhrbacteria bacterium CG10_big_fil_rev_8_21_14_0_10_48_16]|uniref:Ribonuclease H n=1 Tax=Candidatus Uhrbacteria bacterium CG10_big_fil_rev_8_21_14_0_10_48_16 TaxID=1975038 RepID=A0A2M8LG11_9BACT|nr:MAG: ribonuclease H [Candidatus Uhrbacteria bacterium CG10_big_fil_rev_8_21_14_0_10_48_16]